MTQTTVHILFGFVLLVFCACRTQAEVAGEFFLGSRLDALVRAEAGAAVAFLEMYDGRELYFFNRDATRLARVAKIVAPAIGRPNAVERIHALDVSRESYGKPGFFEYIKGQNINQERIAMGVEFVFIDTGYLGTLPEAVIDLYPDAKPGQLKGHMLHCSSFKFPGLESFAEDVGPVRLRAFSMVPDGEFAVGLYSAMPKERGKTMAYRESDGRWEPVFADDDGRTVKDPFEAIDPEQARSVWTRTEAILGSQDLKDFVRERQRLWKDVVAIGLSAGRNGLRDPPAHWRSSFTSERVREAITRDAFLWRSHLERSRWTPPFAGGKPLPSIYFNPYTRATNAGAGDSCAHVRNSILPGLLRK